MSIKYQKDKIINKTSREKKKQNSSGMILKLAFLSSVREWIDTLQVQLPVADFLNLFLIHYAIPCLSKFQKDFKEMLNYF